MVVHSSTERRRVSNFACRALIFDLDGVLADSTEAVNRAWEAWATRNAIDPQVAVRNGHGRTTIEAIRVTAPHLDARESFAQMETLEESFIDRVKPVNGVLEFVRRVVDLNVPWAVATSGTRRIAIPRLQRAGVPSPPVLVTADDVTRGKPDPQPYEKAAQMLGVSPWETLVFEDAPAGILSARRAGARIVAIGLNGPIFADAAVHDFLDVSMSASNGEFVVSTHESYTHCAACDCHTLTAQSGACPLCHWVRNDTADLAAARAHVQEFGVVYAPHDKRFAPSRHPILGPNGEPAIDRVALRDRAYREFRSFAKDQDERARLPERLVSLLACISNADRLYHKVM